MIEIHILLLFMITAAIIAVEVKDLLSSVVAIGAVGIGLSMAFLLLKAPDLAIMQLVVEILSLIILVRATMRKDLSFSASGRWIFNTLSTILFLVIFLTSAYSILKNAQRFGEPAMRASRMYVEKGCAMTGADNIVAAIVLNFRSLDSLGETTALLASVIGILAIARRVGYNK